MGMAPGLFSYSGGDWGLIFSDHDWESDALYLSGASNNLSGGAGGSFQSDVSHMFSNLGLATDASYSRGSMESMLLEHINNPLEMREILKEYIDSADDVIAEYDRITEKKMEIEGLEPQKREYLKREDSEGKERLIDIRCDFWTSDDVMNEGKIREFVKTAIEEDAEYVYPWWVTITSLKQIESSKYLGILDSEVGERLNGVQKTIYREISQRQYASYMGAGGNLFSGKDERIKFMSKIRK